MPAYLRLLIFLPADLIPTCASSCLAFCMMYSAYKLNKQDDNMKPWYTPFPILNLSIVPGLVLTCFLTCMQISQETVKVVWYSHLFKNFPGVVIQRVKGFRIIIGTEVDVFLEFPCLFYHQADVGSVISGSSDFSKSSLYIWNFSVHVLLSLGSRFSALSC